MGSALLPLHLYADELSQARSLDSAGRPAAAAAAYERWLESNTDSPEWGAILFRTAEILPSPSKELALLERWLPAVEQGAVRHGILVRLAQLSELLGRLDRAQIYFEEAAAVPGQRDLRSLLASATILVETGNWEKAATQCRELLHLSKDLSLSVEARILLARVDAADGRKERASTALQELLQPPIAGLLAPQDLLEIWRTASAAGMPAIAEAAERHLAARYPDSPEAALVKNHATPYPTPFALLGGASSPDSVETTSAAPSTASGAPPSAADGASRTRPAEPGPPATRDEIASDGHVPHASEPAAAIQVGAYLDRENAVFRLKEVTDSGFRGEIRSTDIDDKRYYRVLVIDVPEGQGPRLTMLARLRDLGLSGFVTRE